VLVRLAKTAFASARAARTATARARRTARTATAAKPMKGILWVGLWVWGTAALAVPGFQDDPAQPPTAAPT